MIKQAVFPEKTPHFLTFSWDSAEGEGRTKIETKRFITLGAADVHIRAKIHDLVRKKNTNITAVLADCNDRPITHYSYANGKVTKSETIREGTA